MVPFRITCREAQELLSLQRDTSLGPLRRLRLRTHLWMCHGCREVMRHFEILSRAARRLGS